jgi:hypothetical protein
MGSLSAKDRLSRGRRAEAGRCRDKTPGSLRIISAQIKREAAMALCELRTYTLYVGKMAKAVKLYQEIGFPALQKGRAGQEVRWVFDSDTGTINQLLHHQ